MTRFRFDATAAVCIPSAVALLPWLTDLAPDWRAHDTNRLLAIALCLLASVLLLVRSQLQQLAPWRHLVLPIAIPGAVLARALLSPEPEQALREVAVIGGLIALAALVGRAASLTLLGRAVVAATAAYAVSVLAIHYLAANPAVGGNLHASGQLEFFGYSNFRFYNHVQTVVLPLTLGVAALAREPRWRWLARIGAAAAFALLFLAWGRATGLALVMSAGMVLVGGWLAGGDVSRLSRRWLLEMVGTALVGAALMLLLTFLQGGFSGQIGGSREGSNLERLLLFRLSLEHALSSPWFGIGPMHLSGQPGLPAAHPHNAWIQVAAEWGFPVMGALLVAAVVAIRRLFSAARNVGGEHGAWGLVLLATGVAVLVDSLFSGNFVMPMSQLWIAVLGGWILAWWRELPGRTEAPQVLLGRPAIVLLLAVQVWLVVSIWPEVRRFPEFHQELVERYPNNVLNPRFWSHGWFGEPGPR